jgi:hypothetical protein
MKHESMNKSVEKNLRSVLHYLQYEKRFDLSATIQAFSFG